MALVNINAEKVPINMADPMVVEVACPGFSYPRVAKDSSKIDINDMNMP